MLLRNVTTDTLLVPSLNIEVPPDGTFEAVGDDAKSLLTNPAFERADKATGKTDAAPAADNKE